MKLALVGAGEYLEPMASVDRELLALVGPSPTVVCIPTAAGTEGAAMIDDWMQRGVAHFASLGADAAGARVWDRDTANSEELAAQVAAADLVYLSGGKPGYLHETLDGSRCWQAIEEVIERGGLLAGCSAGAMVQGARFAGGPRGRAGFGLWPGVHVIPHFDEIPSAVVRGMRRLVGRRHTVVGVDGNTALVRDGDDLRVVGQSVTVWTADERTVHTAGPLPAGLLPDHSG
ncbi:MAG: Type 1 glutamine amidotransferase-like domain-containing protein [Actinomycetota bacterium]